MQTATPLRTNARQARSELALSANAGLEGFQGALQMTNAHGYSMSRYAAADLLGSRVLALYHGQAKSVPVSPSRAK